MSGARRSRVESQAETRKKLIAAAAELFEEHGFQRTSVAQIAQRAGYTTGAIYSNFGDKEELALAVMERSQVEGWRRLQRSLATHQDFGDRLVAVAEWRRELLRARKPILVLRLELWHQSLHNSKLRDALAAGRVELENRFAMLLEQQAADVGARLTVDGHLLAAAVLGAADGNAISHGFEVSDQDAEAFAWTIANLVLDAMEPTPVKDEDRHHLIGRMLAAAK